MIINFNDSEAVRISVMKDSRKIAQLSNWLHALDQAKNLNWRSDVSVTISLDEENIAVKISQQQFDDSVKELYRQAGNDSKGLK